MPDSGKNNFKQMLNLYHDLFVAENKCDWTATENIAKTLLDIINKYGAPPDENTRDEVMQKMVDYQNMAMLHAAMALQRIAVQRKTTEICKAQLGNLTTQEVF
jgi:Lhr-like helicase